MSIDNNSPWLVLALGNPGLKYELTRHNFGYLVADYLCDRYSMKLSLVKSQQAMVSSFRIAGSAEKIILAKSTSYMNLSGTAAAKIAKYYKISTEKIIVIHDELDLEFGKIRIKSGGGNNGHNGLKHISQTVGNEYIRIRLGIGRPNNNSQDVAGFVLENFAKAQIKELDYLLDKASDAVEAIITEGVATAQNNFHSS